MSAIIACTSWKLAIGRPNCWLSLEYRTDASTQPWQMPTQPEATLKRPESSALMATLKPSPISPSIVSSPTSTSSSEISAVSDARRPSLPWISDVLKPSDSVGTRNQASPRWPCSGSVWAKIIATLAKFPIEIHCFWPEIFQPPSILVARVERLAASEPVLGSVSPKQPSASPEQSLGSHSCFCSSVPQRSIELHTREV